MSGQPSAVIRTVNLIALVFIGVLVGYLLMSGWKRLGAEDPLAETAPTASAPASDSGAEIDEPDSSPVSASLPPLARQRRGSSVSVVGGMSAEELARLQRELQGGDAGEDAEAAPDALPGPGPEAGAAALPPDVTPASVLFSPAVREEARNYLCLCGCGHDLAVCPCNDQPVGAVTMLTHLDRLMESDSDPEAVREGMVARYGERVVLPATESVPAP